MIRYRLDNGLRVVLDPHPQVARVAVSVHYGVGFRSEPARAAGFAHLFEHVMFEGSESVAPLDHGDHIHRVGGNCDARTHQDYTEYFQVVPPEAVELALFLEADRMRAPRFTDEGLKRQLSGVAEEIRTTVTERPYGGFPWPRLPELLYSTFPNAHDGFGSTAALSEVTVEQCQEFFDTYYPPGNATLTLSGNLDPDQVRPLIDRHFGTIPPRPGPPPSVLTVPAGDTPRQGTVQDPRIALPGIAVGYQLPNPATGLQEYVAHHVLAHVLPLAWNKPGFIRRDGGCGIFGPFDARDPDTLILVAIHHSSLGAPEVLAALDAHITELADGALSTDAFTTWRDHLIHKHHHRHADVLARCRALGRLEILWDDAELLDRIPAHLATLTSVDLTAAARRLAAQKRAVLQIVPAPETPV